MGQIPQYQTQEEARPLPTPYDQTHVTPDATGAVGGEVLQQAAGVAFDYAKKAKSDADTARVVQAEAQLGAVYNTAIYDPKEGFVTKRGSDAMAAYGPTVQGLNDARKKILESLANDDQKQAFIARSTESHLQAMRQIETHTYQQGEQANSDAFRAREAVSYNTIANTALNPVARQSEMAQMHDVIIANAQRTGAGADVLKAALQGYDQKAHATVLDQMLSAQLATPAQAYFQQNKAALGTLADDYEKRVREVGVAQKGDFYARALVADPKNRIDGTLLPDPTKIVAAVGQLKEPIEVRDATLARALHQANLITDAQDKRSSAVFGRALKDLDTVGIVNPNDLAYLSDSKNDAGKYFDTLGQMQRRNLEQDVHAPPTPTQEAAFGKAQLAIGADQREYWATQSYEQMAGTFGAQVTRAQLGQLAQDLDQTHKWADEQNRSDRNQAIQTQVKDRLVKNAGFNKDPQKWSDDQWTIFSRALTDVKAQQQGFLAVKKGAQPTPDDVKKWIDAPMAKVKVIGSGFLWDDEPVRAAATSLPQYQNKQAVYVIPSNEQKLIDQQLKDNGFQVNDQTRQSLYRRRHGL